MIIASKVNKCEFSVYTVRNFMKCMHVCTVPTYHLFFTKLYPCLADEIAEPRQNMNINVAAFTVSEKSINMLVHSVVLSLLQVQKIPVL